MFTSIDFNDYTNRRLNFYKNLSSYKIKEEDISAPILLDKLFFDRIKDKLEHYITRRSESTKFTKQENKDYKNLIQEHFPELESIFKQVGPTVYWFKINYSNDLNNEKIISRFTSVKAEYKDKGWWTKTSAVKETDILYLGKVETSFQNRFISHIGLGHNFTTSLKLLYWAPDLPDMTLSFQFLKVENSLKLYLEDIENALWKQSQPLLGASPRIKD